MAWLKEYYEAHLAKKRKEVMKWGAVGQGAAKSKYDVGADKYGGIPGGTKYRGLLMKLGFAPKYRPLAYASFNPQSNQPINYLNKIGPDFSSEKTSSIDTTKETIKDTYGGQDPKNLLKEKLKMKKTEPLFKERFVSSMARRTKRRGLL